MESRINFRCFLMIVVINQCRPVFYSCWSFFFLVKSAISFSKKKNDMKPVKTVRFNMSLKPFVFWAQTETDLFLKVDVKKVEGQPGISTAFWFHEFFLCQIFWFRFHEFFFSDICIEEEEIEFTAKGIGSQGEGEVEKYHFVLEFFLPVDPSRSMIDIVEGIIFSVKSISRILNVFLETIVKLISRKKFMKLISREKNY